jgi:PhnB protein
MTIQAMYPRLVVSDAAKAIEFYLAAFDAKETERYTNPAGKIVHAEVRIGDIRIAVKDEGDGDPAPTSIGGSPVIMAIEVDDADAVGASMERAGATVVYPIQDWEYGSRGGRLADPFGHLWMISQQLEDLTPEEIQRRTDTMYDT